MGWLGAQCLRGRVLQVPGGSTSGLSLSLIGPSKQFVATLFYFIYAVATNKSITLIYFIPLLIFMYLVRHKGNYLMESSLFLICGQAMNTL